MVTATPKLMPYKLRGEGVYEHEFIVASADGSTTTLAIVPATDSLQCGRGMLARVDGLERVLLDKHSVSSMAGLRELERRWAEDDALKVSRAQLDQYRTRKAEIEIRRSLMTSKQRKLDDVKTTAIVQHYEGTAGAGTGRVCRW